VIETDGVNLAEVLAVPHVDHTRTYSNDILEVKSILGVEAARRTMLNEIRLVLNFYGIYVN